MRSTRTSSAKVIGSPAEVNAYLQRVRIPAQIMNAGSLFHLFFQTDADRVVEGHSTGDSALENTFYLHLLNNGVIVPGIHLAFISAAHTTADVDTVIAAFIQSFEDLRAAGHLPG